MRDCQSCGAEFSPTSNAQKWCIDCGPEMRRLSSLDAHATGTALRRGELLRAADSVLNMPTRGGTVDARRPEFTRLLDAVEALGA